MTTRTRSHPRARAIASTVSASPQVVRGSGEKHTTSASAGRAMPVHLVWEVAGWIKGRVNGHW